MQYTCPMSYKKIDENVVRLSGLFTFILLATSLFLPKLSIYIFAFLTIDFAARIWAQELSLLKIIAKNILHKILKIKPKEMDAAPKKFAAGIGLLFSVIILIINLKFPHIEVKSLFTPSNNIFWNDIVENALIIIFLIAVGLETFFAFCLGCKIYSWIQFFKNKIKK